MIDEASQHFLAKVALQRALLRASLFGAPFFSSWDADEAVQAIEWVIETRMALREREILEALRPMIEEQDERTGSVVEGLGRGDVPAGDVPGAGGLHDGSEGQGAADR